MTSQPSTTPIVLHLNVEEILDARCARDESVLPALSSDVESPIPENGQQSAAYRYVYESFVRRFTENANRLANSRAPGQRVVVEAGSILRPWWEGQWSPWDDPFFEEVLDLTSLPTRDEVEQF